LPKRPSVAREVRAIARAFTIVGSALSRLAPLLGQAGSDPIQKADRPRRKLKLSAERRAVLKLQGEYMGYLRGLKPRQKVQVKTLRSAKGFAKAVALAKRFARG